MQGRERSARNITALLILMVLGLWLTSCKNEDVSFPKLTYDTEVTETSFESVPSDTDAPDSIIALTLALPYSSDTTDLLTKLYYAKNNAMIPDDQTGADISIDYLNSIDVPWVINSFQTSSEGVTADNIIEWSSSGSMPDIFLAEDICEVVDTGLAADMNDYLFDNTINSSGIYIDAVNDCIIDGSVYGIPHYATVMMIFGNSDYVPETGRLAFRATTEEFRSYLEAVVEENDDVVPMARGYELIPFIGGAFADEGSVSYMFEDEYTKDREKAVSNASVDASFVAELYRDGLSSDTGESGEDLIITRNAAMWIDSSASMSLWNEYYPGRMYCMQLPSSSTESPAVTMASVYPMCVASASEFKEFASEFAFFLCTDPDALMLLYRLEPQIGFLPLVTNSSVWDVVVSEPVFGTEAMMYEQIMHNNVYCHPDDSVIDYCSRFTSAIGTEEEFEFDLGECLG